MTLTSSRIALIHRCTVLRNQGVSDDWGGESASWGNHLTDQPCRAWTNGGREPVDVDRTAVFIDRRLSLPVGTDVNEEDKIQSVTYRGAEIMDGPMNILAVLAFSDHLELMLERVR